MSRFVLSVGLVALVLCANARAGGVLTHSPAWSNRGFEEARVGCEGGRAVGYSIAAKADAEWLFLVVCERAGFDGEPTYGPAWTSQSFAEARKLCEVPSDASSLGAGRAVGEAILAHTGGGEIFLVVCEKRER